MYLSSLESNLFLREKKCQCITSGKVRFSFSKVHSTETTSENMIITSSYDHEPLRNIKNGWKPWFSFKNLRYVLVIEF